MLRPAVLLLLASAAFAQSISGTVTDSDGVALPNAVLQATNVSTKAVYKTASSDKGAYTLAQLPAGTYEVSAMALAMLPFQRQNIVVGAGQAVRLDIRIQDLPTLNTLGDGREFITSLIVRHKTPEGPTPRAAGGKPDLSGVWHGSFPFDSGTPELLPSAQAILAERRENHAREAPGARCLPQGVALFGTFLPFRIVQTPVYLVMISEADVPNYRQIFLDGRSHPKNLEPTWMGHSVGRWEGDTLVVDTVGFNGKTWMDLEGRPSTEKLRITERYRRPDLGHLEFEFTIDDPGAYVKPWTIKKISDLTPDDEVREFICTENNKDVEHMVGR